MLTLATANPAKYAPFAADLERLRVALAPPAEHLPEIQSLNFIETLSAKARAAAAMFGRPVLVDDTGLGLEAYPSFPGPLTATVLRSLGVPGLRRLLTGTSDRASMECHLGCWCNGALRHWTGAVPGRIDNPAARGTNDLIRSGAKLVADANDVLREFEFLIGPAITAAAGDRRPKPKLTDDERKLVSLLELGEKDVDTLIRESGLTPAAVSSLLIGLEMKRRVRMLPGRIVEKVGD